jgi:hypothetical protein
MNEATLSLVSGCLLLAALLIPVPPRGRAILWVVLIVTLWTGTSLADMIY